MAKAKKSKSGGKAKKDKSAGKAKKDKSGGKGSEEEPESKGKDDKSGSKENKDKSGGKKKKDKSGSKEKKDKSGGKAKKGSKGSTSGKKSASASSSKEKLSSQQKAKDSGGTSTPDSTTSSTAGQAAVCATSSEGLFKPLKRQPFSPLVLPGDQELTLVRRPNTVYVWDCNMWFFPMSVFAVALVVLGMVVMSLHLQETEELQAEDLDATGVGNGTTVGVTPTTRSWTEDFHPTRPKTVPKRRRRAGEQKPSGAMPFFPEHLSTPNTWTETTASTVVIAANEDAASTAVINAEGEADEESSKAGASDVDVTQDWLHAPRKDSQETSLSCSPLIEATPSKGVETDKWAQNATATKVDES